jgi:hypothetical protein
MGWFDSIYLTSVYITSLNDNNNIFLLFCFSLFSLYIKQGDEFQSIKFYNQQSENNLVLHSSLRSDQSLEIGFLILETHNYWT